MTAVMSATDACLSCFTLPKCLTSSVRRAAPSPLMLSSSLRRIRADRCCLWKVMANRCASSRMCWIRKSAWECRGRMRGYFSPATQISSSRLAMPMTGTSVIPSSSSTCWAAATCAAVNDKQLGRVRKFVRCLGFFVFELGPVQFRYGATVKVVSKESAAGDFGDACHVIGVPVAGGVGDFVPPVVGFFRQPVFEDHEGCHHVGALDVGDVRAFDP